MKKILKFISGGLVASSSLIPLATLSGCGLTKYDAITDEMKQQVIEEFTNLSKNYRATYHNIAVCQYIEQWAKDNGFTPVNDSATYKPYQKEDDNGYNIYFDVPASSDGANIPNVILQGHTDMVAQGDIESMKTEGVIPYIDGNKMYSKDHKTSLGADNGIGIASMLVLAKNKDKFTHGKIRMLFTTDEEDGPSGAEQVPNSWFNDYIYIINCDSENANEMSIACGGAVQAYAALTELEFTNPTKTGYEIYDINISGLLGGHSALQIDEGHINAIKLMSRYLSNLIFASSEDSPIQIYSAWDGGSIDDETHGGTIPSKCTMRISSYLTLEKMQEIANTLVAQSIKDHPSETNLKLEITKLEDKSTETRAPLNADDTYGLVNLLNDLPFGVFSYGKYGVQTSSSIGGLRIRDNAVCEGKDTVYVEVFGRSFNTTKLLDLLSSYNTSIHDANTFGSYKKESGSYKYNFTQIAINHPWVSDDDDKLQATIMSGAQAIKHDLKKTAYGWWLEVGAFARKAEEALKKVHMASIGITVHDPHSVQETIELDTINKFLKVTLYTLENLTN